MKGDVLMLFTLFSYRSNRAFSFPQLKKRKLEIESSTTSMSTITKVYPKNQDMNEQRDEKRRRKPTDEIKQDIDTQKQILLPQKKRVLPISTCNSPAKKTQKLTSSQDESAADETLIRETEAALKSLSGSWPGPRGSSYPKQEESPAFENLFDEKKAVKLSPSSTSNSSTDNTCSLKDVITLRDQHDDTDKDVQLKMKVVKIKQENDSDTPKSEDEYMQLKSKRQFKSNIEPSRYDPPDFNELVDDSSNELEIDMSEAASDKNDSGDEKCENKTKRRESEESTKPSRYSTEEHQSAYHPFTRPPTSSPFSTTSAFRPPQTTKSTTLTPLGPYPAEATFVGYPSTLPAPLPVEEKLKIPKTEEQDTSTLLTSIKSSVGSPEGVNKQYTILQPAGVGSRAASALQEAAREGVPTVSAVSSSASNVAAPKLTVATASLSPGSIGRGKFV